MDQVDLRLLRAVQDGVKMTQRPYRMLGEEIGLSEEEVISRLRRLEAEGVVRRFAATIGHRALGIVANALIVWRVPQTRVVAVGELFAGLKEVTHCYERAAAPEWPYNLYTMVHSRSREECLRIADHLSEISGIGDYLVLFSEKEYKKTSTRI
ncbi:MAG: AsnC family transcriptional regulator [Methanothrix sp.]|nr:AsnC family transcriptional regulator [Methanothrix sp.]